jgi:hypothetical protein
MIRNPQIIQDAVGKALAIQYLSKKYFDLAVNGRNNFARDRYNGIYFEEDCSVGQVV